jgi:hypothetical protein
LVLGKRKQEQVETSSYEVEVVCSLKDLVKDGCIILDRERWLVDFSLWYGNRLMDNNIPTLLFDDYSTLRAAVGWDGHMDVRGWSSDEPLLSLGSKDTLSSIMDLI